MRVLWYTFLTLFSLGMLTLVAGVGAGVYAISYFSKDLPDYTALKTYQPPEVTRVYAGDGHLLAEFAQQKRIFVPVDNIPPIVREAFISAEDKNFYRHSGVDLVATGRAVVIDTLNHGRGKRPEGASTITQQVAKNMLVGNERSLRRKIREALVAFKIERALSKNQILEIYLNEIYLGEGSYGVAAAAQAYFNKPLIDLTVPEAAYLAELPKGPSDYDPIRHHDAALARRAKIIQRMLDNGYITREEATAANATKLDAAGHEEVNDISAPFFAEEVRRQLAGKYGDSSLYEGGLAVRTSLDPHLQDLAEHALRYALMQYDRRHGWRGPLGHLDHTGGWQSALAAFHAPNAMLDSWKLGVVLHTAKDGANVGLADGSEIKILTSDIAWARKQSVPAVTSADQVVRAGDVIMVEPDEADDAKGSKESESRKFWQLRQIPKVNGALMAMDPHTGRVLAMQGGWSFKDSVFNRTTQAYRQPGSSFKPFVYITALQNGFTPATQVLDAPMVLSQGAGMPAWAPKNYKNEQFGNVPLRIGLEKSLNLVTIRVAAKIGMPPICKTAKDFGVADNMAPNLANAIGAQVTTIWRMVTGYSEFVNGGKKIVPTLIDRVQDRDGRTIFNHDSRSCAGCGPLVQWQGQAVPAVPDNRPQIVDPRYAYQMVSMMEGVVQRGTGEALKVLGRPLAGKTGTTNDSKDVWFIGYTPDLVVGLYVGYDQPKTLGSHETGASVAIPGFQNFMTAALADVPPTPFRVPPGIRKVLINRRTGNLAQPGDTDVLWENFIEGTEPGDKANQRLDAAGMQDLPMGGDGGGYTGGDNADGDDTGTDSGDNNSGGAPNNYGRGDVFSAPRVTSDDASPMPGHDVAPAAPATAAPENSDGGGTGGLY